MWKDSQPQQYIYVAISSLLVKGVFDTIDGLPISNVYEKWGRGEPNNAGGSEECVSLNLRELIYNDDNCARQNPFVCKKTLDTLKWNIPCNMSDTEYVHSESLNACYKFHLTPKNWTDAHATCNAEQSYLAVIESQNEADYLVKLTRNAPKNRVRGNFVSGSVILGFHNIDEEGWKTVKGVSMEEGGYYNWAQQLSDESDQEKCGSMLYNGEIKDLNCSRRCFFICEHNLPNMPASQYNSTNWYYPDYLKSAN